MTIATIDFGFAKTGQGEAYASASWPPPYSTAFSGLGSAFCQASRGRFAGDDPLYTRMSTTYLQWTASDGWEDNDPTGWALASATFGFSITARSDDSDGYLIEGYWTGADLPSFPAGYQTAPTGVLAFSVALSALGTGNHTIALSNVDQIATGAGDFTTLAIWCYKGGTAPQGYLDGLVHRNGIDIGSGSSFFGPQLVLTQGSAEPTVTTVAAGAAAAAVRWGTAPQAGSAR